MPRNPPKKTEKMMTTHESQNESWTWQLPSNAQEFLSRKRKHSDAESLDKLSDDDDNEAGRYSKYFKFSSKVLAALQLEAEAQGQQ